MHINLHAARSGSISRGSFIGAVMVTLYWLGNTDPTGSYSVIMCVCPSASVRQRSHDPGLNGSRYRNHFALPGTRYPVR